ncbi:uncharacterized protein LOC121599592 [Anopheles merus]|uniref:uncharacterized protein LOC121599592 n=1 Tax=Anopheles merus TaxID=30066 RepID=UPI001BE47F6C|nr:uncharacterized protein LOC121599592 [Anopheles merus]
MWNVLENTFAKKSSGRQIVIRNQIAHLQQFEDLVRQLRVAGLKLEETDVCSAFSIIFPESYDPLMTALENLPESQLTYELMKTQLLDPGRGNFKSTSKTCLLFENKNLSVKQLTLAGVKVLFK